MPLSRVHPTFHTPYQDGDVLVERSRGLVASAIRWLTASDWNHAGLLFEMTAERRAELEGYGLGGLPNVGDWCVLEAVAQGVVVHALTDRLAESSRVMLARSLVVKVEHLGPALVRTALTRAGEAYGYARLAAFWWGIVFHRLRKATDTCAQAEQVCSTLVAFAYKAAAGLNFGTSSYRSITPGQIAKVIEGDSLLWTVYLRE